MPTSRIGEGYENVLRNSIDRCGQPIKDRGCFEVALVIRILFRLLPPPFALFFEVVPKFHTPNDVYSLRVGFRKASTVPLQQSRQLGDIGVDAPGLVLVRFSKPC